MKNYLSRAGRFILKPVKSRLLGAVTRVDTKQKALALTFDDGPHPENTPIILDILKNHTARATFFVVGMAVAKFPEILARIKAEGHCLGNHSWSHPSLSTIRSRDRINEIRRCADTLQPYKIRYFRPPFGHLDIWSGLDVLRSGHEIVAWSTVAGDWQDVRAEIMFEKISGAINPGSILLLHDGLWTFEKKNYQCRKQTFRLLEMILDEYGKEYTFVNMEDIMKTGRPVRVDWRMKPDIQWLSTLHRCEFTA